MTTVDNTTADEQRTQLGGSSRTSLAESLVGQATAALAFTAAVVYAAGGLTLGLQLWFLRVPWTPVLGQLPRDFIGITAVGQVILPCVIAGAAIGSGIDRSRVRITCYWDAGELTFLGVTAAIAIVGGAVLGLAPFGILHFTQHTAAGVLRPWPEIWVNCSIFSMVALFIALCILRHLYKGSSEHEPVNTLLRRTLAGTVCAMALIPCLCSISAGFLLPQVELCGPKFMHPVPGQSTEEAGYMKGNLIGSNSQWIYIAQFQYHGDVVWGRTITAVPESSVQLEAIGKGSGCGDLRS
jgi:hypothetical protein